MNTVHAISPQAADAYRSVLTEAALRLPHGPDGPAINLTVSTLDPLPAVDRSDGGYCPCFVFKTGSVVKTNRTGHIQLLHRTGLRPQAQLVVRAALLDVSLPKAQ